VYEAKKRNGSKGNGLVYSNQTAVADEWQAQPGGETGTSEPSTLAGFAAPTIHNNP
jgi:hypothetical protein